MSTQAHFAPTGEGDSGSEWAKCLVSGAAARAQSLGKPNQVGWAAVRYHWAYRQSRRKP